MLAGRTSTVNGCPAGGGADDCPSRRGTNNSRGGQADDCPGRGSDDRTYSRGTGRPGTTRTGAPQPPTDLDVVRPVHRRR